MLTLHSPENNGFRENNEVCTPWFVYDALFRLESLPERFGFFTARFSPDDKFSRHRVTIKKRFGVLLTQTPAKPM